MGNKDNKKRYILKRNKVERSKDIARIMREAKQKKKENKFLEIECPPEQGKLMETPSQLLNLVSVPPNSEDTKMAMSVAERQLRCREKLKSQKPEKHEEKKRKHTEYMKNKRTFFGQLPATEQNKRRKQRREANERKGNKTKMKKDQDSSGNEIKVFCPKCNTEVPHTAEGIQEDQTKILIAKVYHYFEHEYEELKKMYGDLDLSPLSRFQQRTALATGVSETTVLQILKEEEGRHADKLQEPPKKRRIARKRSRQPDSSSEEDSSDDNIDDGGQSSFVQLAHKEPEIETLVVKIEPLEYYKEQPQTDPISIEVKAEPPDDDVNNANETLALNEPAGTKRKASKIPGSDVTSTQQHTQGESSTTATTSSDQLTEQLHESGLLGGTEVKLEKIEIGEEGFS